MCVIKDFELRGGFPAHNKYKFKFIYYYADFRTPNCLMTLVTHDTRDHSPSAQRNRPYCALFLFFSCKTFVNRNGNVVPLHYIKDVVRVWAAAQQRPSKLASAFALHHTCQCIWKCKTAIRTKKPGHSTRPAENRTDRSKASPGPLRADEEIGRSK